METAIIIFGISQVLEALVLGLLLYWYIRRKRKKD